MVAFMTDLAPEYIAARGVLLDALDALVAHRSSLVLVGAQAIYLHTGAVAGTGIQMTTDSDLALDVDILSDDPELTAALRAARFFPAGADLPGQGESPTGIRVDLMTVPHQSNRPGGRRSADLSPHGKDAVRITPGLEPALIDDAAMPVKALAEGDNRSIELRVAGPAALLTAKLIKLHERCEAVQAGKGKANRLKEKDALDCYRLLVAIQTDDLRHGFESHRSGVEALAVTRAGLLFFDQQRHLGANGALHALLAQALPGNLVALASFDALSDDLVEALSKDLVTIE